MSLFKEIWLSEIEGNLFPDNSFLTRSIDDSAYVTNKIVHIPQAGLKPNVVLNRTSVPAVIDQREDTDLTYQVEDFSTDPVLIKRTDDEQFLSYDKVSNVLREHEDTIRQKFSDYTLRQWAPVGGATPSGTILQTSGANGTANDPTGTAGRKILAFADLLAAQERMNALDVPMNNRNILLDSKMYQELLSDPDLRNSRFVEGQPTMTGMLPTGLAGFNVWVRSTVLTYNAARTAPVDGVIDNTMHRAALCWYDNHVRTAQGAINLRADIDKPEYYGSIFSAEVFFGASKSRTKSEGVVAIVQADNA